MTQTDSFDDILATCLEMLEQGRSVDEVLRDYPEEAAELRPLLRLWAVLDMRRLEPTVRSKRVAQADFLTTAAFMRQQQAKSRPGGWNWRSFLSGVLATGFAALLILVVVGAAAQTAVPGDVLYGAKLYGEQLQVELTGDVDSRLQLQEELTKRRRDEIRALLDSRRQEPVSFTGEIQAISGDTWQVEGIAVTVPTAVFASGQVGMVVTVNGTTTADGSVLAAEIAVLSAVSPTPTPTLLPSPAPSQTPTPSPTPTETATPLPTTTPPAPATTETINPTSTLPTVPIVQPTRDDDDGSDDSSDDDSDDSSDDDSDDSSDDDSDDSSDDDSDDSSDDGSDDSSDDGSDDSSDDDSDDSSDDNDDSSDDDSDDSSDDDSDDSSDDDSDDSSDDDSDDSSDGSDDSSDGSDDSSDDD